MDDFIPQDQWINASERNRVPRIIVPKVDELISKIVGKNVLSQDPRLLRLIIKYKNGKSQDSLVPDNFLENPNFIKELKEIFQ